MEINKVTRNERWDYGLWMKSKAKGRSWCTRKDTQSRSQSRPPNPLDFGWSPGTTDSKLDTEGKRQKGTPKSVQVGYRTLQKQILETSDLSFKADTKG